MKTKRARKAPKPKLALSVPVRLTVEDRELLSWAAEVDGLTVRALAAKIVSAELQRRDRAIKRLTRQAERARKRMIEPVDDRQASLFDFGFGVGAPE